MDTLVYTVDTIQIGRGVGGILSVLIFYQIGTDAKRKYFILVEGDAKDLRLGQIS